jgi:hypothetical protein
MSTKIIKLNEGALRALGMPSDVVEALRHLVRQAGTITLETTLPEVVSKTNSLVPLIEDLTVTLAATNVALADIEVMESEHQFSDSHSMARRLDEIQAELERANGERAALAREVSRLRDEIGMAESGAIETGSSIRYKLGVTTLSGSNTGDQTLASLGAAAVAGSSAQDFACKILTTSANSVINTVKIGTAANSNFYVDTTHAAVRPMSAVAGAGIYLQNSAGAVTWALVTVLGLQVAAGFGCNGAAVQTPFALGAASTDLASVITLANNLRTMAINNGMGS